LEIFRVSVGIFRSITTDTPILYYLSFLSES
jgi:hypothetical protein